MWHPLLSPLCVAVLLCLQQAGSSHANGTAPGGPALAVCSGQPLTNMAGSPTSGHAQVASSAPRPQCCMAEAPHAWQGGGTATNSSQSFRDVAQGDEEGDGGPVVAFITEAGARLWRKSSRPEQGADVPQAECCLWNDAAGSSCRHLSHSSGLLYRSLILPACKATILVVMVASFLVAILTGTRLLARCMKRYQSWRWSEQQGKEGWLASSQSRVWGAAAHSPCAICLQAYKPRQALKLLSCSHVYHSKCIDLWHRAQPRSKTCPLCLRGVTTVELIPLRAHNGEQE